MRAAVLVTLLATLPAAASPAPHKPPPPAQLEDPCTDEPAAEPCKHHALDAFHAALAAARDRKADHPLRVSYFGDSLTADDHITTELRDRLQELVGDGGAGFVFAAPPHPYCQLHAIGRVVSEGWTSYGISSVVPPDHLLGLGAARELDVHYLAQPHGGTLDITVDNQLAATLRTAADHKQGAFERVELAAGAKRIELRARGRVRLFGATLEAKSGAVVDNLGIVNATAKQMRNHNLDEHWRNQLAHRAPDLVVLMYGTNEAEWLRPHGAGMEEHEKLFGELLATVRAAAPNASCLVVSPLDQLDWHDDALPPRDSIPAMVEAQRRAALAHGCAFWDTYTWMGGKGSSAAWHKRGLMAKDFQHPTSEGAERLAEALYAGLVAR